MKMKRIITAFLSLVMVFGALTPVAVQPVSAAYEDKVKSDGSPVIDYLNTAYLTPDEKLEDMIMVKEENGHQIWYEEFTGEVAFRDVASGQILFTNPWDVAATYNKSSASTRAELLSQVLITYTDKGVEKTMNSYTDAALRNQIIQKNIKGGIRVEYTIGEEQTIRLVPRLIPKERFESMILDQIDNEWVYSKVTSYYTLQDPNDPSLTSSSLQAMYSRFPITKKMAVYVCTSDISARELRNLEGYIKDYCPLYTYEELDIDHMTTNYSGSDAAPPMFKLAIEYKITEDGDLEARLSAGSIRYDETAYQLKNIRFLPYFGAGSNQYTGYTMIPDGSGTLIRFEDVKGKTYNISGKMYGADYAYHKVDNQHTETMRWPVYGVVTNYDIHNVDKETGVVTDFHQNVGFLAIITEGDSLTSLMSSHGGNLHTFNTVYPTFTPRPSDQYELNYSDSISVTGASAVWSVESDRKYTGSYRIVYKMLTDESIALEKNLDNTYSCDYVGMAKALRDFWTKDGTLSALTDTTADTPLYIESFGSIKTTERIFSFPVTVDTPLTTFENIQTMADELTSMGVGRLNFRLNGFANGGMYPTMPYKLKWMDSVGGSDGFEDLLVYAAENNVGIYPDFDFVYEQNHEMLDGFSFSKHAVKTIDDRYTTQKYYDASTQTFLRGNGICVSSSVYEYFYNKFTKNYSKYGVDSISVSTLGDSLNSDFDPDDPYNREDSKEFTKDLLAQIDQDYTNVMVDGGNAYTLPYVDHILNAPTDSSRFIQASETIPFIGLVLHGSKYMTSAPINMEGDINSAILKAIENGSYLYFLLSYQNTSKLKEDVYLSDYYSLAYDIWKEEVVEYYTILNDATKDLQTSLIVDHEFLYGERVPDADELAADAAEAQAELDAIAEAEAKKLAEAEREKQFAILHGGVVEDEPEQEEEPITEETPEQTEDTTEETDADSDTTEDTVTTEPEAGAYVKTKYTTASGSIVRVEYEGDVNFLLNYNSFDVTVVYNGTTYTLEALGFVRID